MGRKYSSSAPLNRTVKQSQCAISGVSLPVPPPTLPRLSMSTEVHDEPEITTEPHCPRLRCFLRLGVQQQQEGAACNLRSTCSCSSRCPGSRNVCPAHRADYQ